MKKKMDISTSPYLRSERTTDSIMRELSFTLIPLYGVSIYFFGLSIIWLSLSAVLGGVLIEFLVNRNGLKDNSTLLTSLLLAFTLPPGIALWMAFLGGFVAVGMGKLLWGGLGQNIFNPALVGRAFLQSAFPTAITTWTEPQGWNQWFQGYNLAPPFLQAPYDGVTTATPLSKMKFESISTESSDLLFGQVSGSLGETSSIILIIIGIYLLLRKIIHWRIPAAILISITVLALFFHLLSPEVYPRADFTLLSGGLLFAVVYMATDPVTSPLAPKGQWIYGIGIGILVILIRYWGGLPEGVMYAILLMNAATPMINKYVKIRTYGHA